jgi:putative regulator of septum formation
VRSRTSGRVGGRLLGLVLVLAVVPASGCTGGEQPSTTGSSSTSTPTSTPTVTPTVSPSGAAPASPTVPSATPPAAPARGACYRLSARQLTRRSSSSPAVPCDTLHTTRTVYVARPAPATGATTGPAPRQPAEVCPGRLADYLGGSVTDRRLSRFDVVWFTPTPEQSLQGAAWFRCDLVAFAGSTTLYPLPRSGSLRGVLGRRDALRTYGRCATAAPGTKAFTLVICARSHSWRAFDTVSLSGGGAYPGAAKVRRAGADVCKKRARAEAGGALKFTWGWEWPSAEQWSAGQHYGYCWVPS